MAEMNPDLIKEMSDNLNALAINVQKMSESLLSANKIQEASNKTTNLLIGSQNKLAIATDNVTDANKDQEDSDKKLQKEKVSLIGTMKNMVGMLNNVAKGTALTALANNTLLNSAAEYNLTLYEGIRAGQLYRNSLANMSSMFKEVGVETGISDARASKLFQTYASGLSTAVPNTNQFSQLVKNLGDEFGYAGDRLESVIKQIAELQSMQIGIDIDFIERLKDGLVDNAELLEKIRTIQLLGGGDEAVDTLLRMQNSSSNTAKEFKTLSDLTANFKDQIDDFVAKNGNKLKEIFEFLVNTAQKILDFIEKIDGSTVALVATVGLVGTGLTSALTTMGSMKMAMIAMGKDSKKIQEYWKNVSDYIRDSSKAGGMKGFLGKGAMKTGGKLQGLKSAAPMIGKALGVTAALAIGAHLAGQGIGNIASGKSGDEMVAKYSDLAKEDMREFVKLIEEANEALAKGNKGRADELKQQAEEKKEEIKQTKPDLIDEKNIGTAAVGGAVAGGAIGSIVPVIGTAIGAALGGLAGTFGALLAANSTKDETIGKFKDAIMAAKIEVSIEEAEKDIADLQEGLTSAVALGDKEEQLRIEKEILKIQGQIHNAANQIDRLGGQHVLKAKEIRDANRDNEATIKNVTKAIEDQMVRYENLIKFIKLKTGELDADIELRVSAGDKSGVAKDIQKQIDLSKMAESAAREAKKRVDNLLGADNKVDKSVVEEYEKELAQLQQVLKKIDKKKDAGKYNEVENSIKELENIVNLGKSEDFSEIDQASTMFSTQATQEANKQIALEDQMYEKSYETQKRLIDKKVSREMQALATSKALYGGLSIQLEDIERAYGAVAEKQEVLAEQYEKELAKIAKFEKAVKTATTEEEKLKAQANLNKAKEKALELEAEQGKALQDQLELTKEISTGYLSALTSQALSAGAFDKLLLTREKNVDQIMEKRKNQNDILYGGIRDRKAAVERVEKDGRFQFDPYTGSIKNRASQKKAQEEAYALQKKQHGFMTPGEALKKARGFTGRDSTSRDVGEAVASNPQILGAYLDKVRDSKIEIKTTINVEGLNGEQAAQKIADKTSEKLTEVVNRKNKNF